MKVNPVRMLPLSSLRHNPDNPKRPMGARYHRGLKASLERFGFAGLFVVAPEPDGTFEVLDGNTRLDELDGNASEVPCVVLDLDADGRKAFSLAHDRNRKLFDEDKVVEQLKELAGRGHNLKELADLTATENLRQLVEAQRVAQAAVKPHAQPQVMPAQGSLVLYGPAEDVEAVRQLVKRIRGRMPAATKARIAVEQAEAMLDLSDEDFLLVFLSVLERIQGVG